MQPPFCQCLFCAENKARNWCLEQNGHLVCSRKDVSLNRSKNQSREATEQAFIRLRTCSFLFIMILGMSIASGWGLRFPASSLAEEAIEKTVILDAIHDPSVLEGFSFPDEARILRIAFPQIMECDSCLVTDGKESILIDCATEGQAESVVSMLRKQGIERLNRIYITHPHADHAGGLKRILEEFRADSVWTCFSDLTNPISEALPGICEAFDVPLMRYEEGHSFTLGGAQFVTYASTDRALGINDRSAAFRMQYGDAVMFFAADLEARGLRRIGNMLDPELLKMDIIKYPHHGKNGLVREFWRPAQLRYAIVTSDSTPREGKEDLVYKGWAHAFTAYGEIVLLTDGETWCICWEPDAARILSDSLRAEEEQVIQITVRKKEETDDQ